MKAPDRVVIIGGGSGMGLALAKRVLAAGAEVVIAGRTHERLHAARTSLGADRLEVATVDIGDRSQVAALFARVDRFDHLVMTAADLPYGPVMQLTESDLMRAVRSKFLGPVFAAQESAARIRPGGSITFTSGIAARRPMRGGSGARYWTSMEAIVSCEKRASTPRQQLSSHTYDCVRRHGHRVHRRDRDVL